MFTGVKIDDYLSLASKWLDEKKFGAVNSIAAGILWGIWLSEITVAGHQDGAPENLDLHDGMDTNLQAGHGSCNQTMVQLLGGSAKDPLGDCLTATARKVLMSRLDNDWKAY
jgi:hypothetical protein